MIRAVGIRGKRRILQGLLVFLALWPAVQLGLTRAFAVNPWKLFGYAMYSVPGPRGEIYLVGMRDGSGPVLLEPDRLSRDERLELSRYYAHWAELGELASADALARRVLALHPELESLVITTRRYWIEPGTARVAAAARHIRYWPDGRREAFDPASLGSP